LGIERGLLSYNRLLRLNGRASIALGPMFSQPVESATGAPLKGYNGKYQIAGYGTTVSVGTTLQVVNAVSLLFTYSVHGSITKSLKTESGEGPGSTSIIANTFNWGIKVNVGVGKNKR